MRSPIHALIPSSTTHLNRRRLSSFALLWGGTAGWISVQIGIKIGFGILIIAQFIGRTAAQSSAVETQCGQMPSQFQNLAELLTRIQELGVALGLLIAAVMLVYGGILWMRGTPDSQQKARRIIFNTIVGLTIVLMAGGLVEFVNGILCSGGG